MYHLLSPPQQLQEINEAVEKSNKMEGKTEKEEDPVPSPQAAEKHAFFERNRIDPGRLLSVLVRCLHAIDQNDMGFMVMP